MPTNGAGVADWGGRQASAVKRLELAQPRLNDLLRGRIDNVSVDALTVLAALGGSRIQIRIERPAA